VLPCVSTNKGPRPGLTTTLVRFAFPALLSDQISYSPAGGAGAGSGAGGGAESPPSGGVVGRGAGAGAGLGAGGFGLFAGSEMTPVNRFSIFVLARSSENHRPLSCWTFWSVIIFLSSRLSAVVAALPDFSTFMM